MSMNGGDLIYTILSARISIVRKSKGKGFHLFKEGEQVYTYLKKKGATPTAIRYHLQHWNIKLSIFE